MAVLDASRELDRVFARPAPKIDDPIVRTQRQAREDQLERLRAIAPEAMVEFGIPVGHRWGLSLRRNQSARLAMIACLRASADRPARRNSKRSGVPTSSRFRAARKRPSRK